MTDKNIIVGTAPYLQFTYAGLRLTVQFDRYTFDCPMFKYQFDDASSDLDEGVICSGDDLGLGANADSSLRDAMGALINFLEAFVEARDRDSETNLFPDALWDVLENDTSDWVDTLHSYWGHDDA